MDIVAACRASSSGSTSRTKRHHTNSRVPQSNVTSYSDDYCEISNATLIALGKGTKDKVEYAGDPNGVMDEFTSGSYAASTELPKDAADTGYRRDGRQLWLSDDRKAAYLVDADDITDAERLPVVTEGFGCG